MPFVKIIRKTIVSPALHPEIDEVLAFDGLESTLSSSKLTFKKGNLDISLELTFSESDYASKTYLSTLPSGKRVRVIVFEGTRADEFKTQQNALEYFSIGSISNSGFGIFFILQDEQNNQVNSPQDTSTKAMAERLLIGANMELLLGNVRAYAELIERVASFASPATVTQILGWQDVLEPAISNKTHFSDNTQKWLSQLLD